ncbi:hypothetical protein PG990_006946 [Apiospora arundinis]
MRSSLSLVASVLATLLSGVNAAPAASSEQSTFSLVEPETGRLIHSDPTFHIYVKADFNGGHQLPCPQKCIRCSPQTCFCLEGCS